MDRDGRNGTDDARRSPRAGDAIRDLDSATRWWRDFVSSPAMRVPVAVTIGERTVDTTTDASGLIDLTVRGHGLPPGRHQVLLSTPHADDAHADVIVVSTTQRFGVVSDIDDTVLSTSLPRPVIAAWNTFVREEGTRRAVPGMATLYRELRAAHPDMPFVYLSHRLVEHRPESGPLPSPPRLSVGAPPPHGLGSHEHRLVPVRAAAQAGLAASAGPGFPPSSGCSSVTTANTTRRCMPSSRGLDPGSVRAIAIRQLTTGEQVLSTDCPSPTTTSCRHRPRTCPCPSSAPPTATAWLGCSARSSASGDLDSPSTRKPWTMGRTSWSTRDDDLMDDEGRPAARRQEDADDA